MAIVITHDRGVRETIDDTSTGGKLYRVYNSIGVIWERTVHSKPTKTFFVRRINAGQEQSRVAHQASEALREVSRV